MAKRILIIEDDVFLGDVLLQKLKNESYDVFLARDGAEGLSKIKELKPDMVLLDIVLPTMNGYEILENKVKDPIIADIPVIVISNSGQPVEINRVLSFGVKDYLIKAQFDPNEVLVKVRSHLDSSPMSGNGTVVQQPATDTLEGRTLLWVEDDKFLSDLISRKLSTQGCKLIHATAGEDALQILETENPDVILLDILLPGMTGFEILQKVKNNSKTKHIPVMMLSNMGQKSDMDKGTQYGAEKFLIKATVTLDEIIKEIKKLIKK